MRGTVILWRDDKGVVTAGGQRYDFDINHWNGAVAPAPNMTVDLATTDGKLTGLTPVNEAGRRRAKAIFPNVGKDVAIGYGVFLFVALFVSLVATDGVIGVKVTLADLLSGDMARAALGGGGSKGVLLVLLATATIAVPYLWRYRLAPLAFAVPLLFTAWALWPFYEQHQRQQEALRAMGEFGQAMTGMAEQTGAQTSAFDSIGIGAWLLVATVIFLAFKGIARFLARSQPAVTSSSAS
jgi:membrane protein implicated in regulation of membrane protease activity